jgi:hypothetical protein
MGIILISDHGMEVIMEECVRNNVGDGAVFLDFYDVFPNFTEFLF